eukprot:7442559-Pyramimonas_sp.AAC.2
MTSRQEWAARANVWTGPGSAPEAWVPDRRSFPGPEPERFRITARSFPCVISAGLDGLRPRRLVYLRVEATCALGALCEATKSLGMLPKQLSRGSSDCVHPLT